MKKVVIIQRALKFYNVPFFNLLKQKLNDNGIELILLYGNDDNLKFNDAELAWGIKIKNYKINIFRKVLYYQPVLKYIKGADLIIVEQASKLLINYYLWILNLIGYKKLAFWGHGINFQSSSHYSIAELVKRIMTRRVNWFFAYTDLTRQELERIGYPVERITTVNNTIDVEGINEIKRKWDSEDIKIYRKQLGCDSGNICLFVGGMYAGKRLDFLIDALFLVKKSIPDFHFLFIGDGPDKTKVLNASKDNKWIHYLGYKNDTEKIPYFLLSKLLLIPSLVGLVIIDSFIFGVPMVTTNFEGHGPEIDYLENNKNGIMTKNNLNDYSAQIIELLQNENKRLILVKGCKKSAGKYTMSKMVDIFLEGILSNLNL